VQRDRQLALALGTVAGAVLLFAPAALTLRGALAALALVSGVGSMAFGFRHASVIGLGACALGLALAPTPSSPWLLALGASCGLCSVGLAAWGAPSPAWAPWAILVALAALLGILPLWIAPRLAGLASAPFLLVVAAMVGAPCVAIAVARRERHLELKQ
jgi:hypothetical protein